MSLISYSFTILYYIKNFKKSQGFVIFSKKFYNIINVEYAQRRRFLGLRLIRYQRQKRRLALEVDILGMQVFEFHFNPKAKPDLIFDSFCYEPENIYEKRLGGLYLMGILKNVLPQNFRFLENLAKTIKGRYYRLTLKTPEKALKESLKEANEFLEQIAKKGDVRWLGNLSFAVLSLTPRQKFGGGEMNFTKVGDLKIHLLRAGRVIDIDRKLKFEEITPWPLRIFGNIVSGKLTENDVILVSTKEVTDFFEKENLLPEMAKLESFDQKSVKEIFDEKREEILKISGVLLAIILTKEILAGKKEVITPKLHPKEFKLKEVFTPFTNFFKKITPRRIFGGRPKLSLKLPRFRFPSFNFRQAKGALTEEIGKRAKLKLPEIKLPKLNKSPILILALIFFLFLGFIVAQREEKQKFEQYQAALNEIQEKVAQAESFLILKEIRPEATKDANLLLIESWEEISPLVKLSPTLPKNFADQVLSLKEDISENLHRLSKLEIIKEPNVLFEFATKEFIPQKVTIFNDDLYFFSPYAENIFKLDKELKDETIETGQKFNLAVPLENSIVFFSKPDHLTILFGRDRVSTKLKEPYPDFNFDAFSFFRENLYFLDKQAGQIVKYPYQGNFQWREPELWLKRAASLKHLSIDGSVWALAKNNSIEKYDLGQLQEKIELGIFPSPKDFTKIFTSPALSYLYILEPAQNRIIVINKTGQVIKQLQSEKFDNLLDFAVSKDGKTIYLLNGLKVYQIKL